VALFTPEEQARRLGRAWKSLVKNPQRSILLLVVEPKGEVHEFWLSVNDSKPNREERQSLHRNSKAGRKSEREH